MKYEVFAPYVCPSDPMTSNRCVVLTWRDPSTTIVRSNPTHRVPSGGVVFGS